MVSIGLRHLGILNGRIQTASVLSILGVSTGLSTLIVVVAVMNGFQLEYIEDMLEVGSYHLQVRSNDNSLNLQEFKESLALIDGVKAIVEFSEQYVLIGADLSKQENFRSWRNSMRGLLLRSISPDVMDIDKNFANHLIITSGVFDLKEPFSLVIGSELADSLQVKVGDFIEVISFNANKGFLNYQALSNSKYKIKGIFRTGHYEYDLSWAFTGFYSDTLRGGKNLNFSEHHNIIGVKLDNKLKDLQAVKKIKSLINDFNSDSIVESWRTFNSAFFSALRTEKLLLVIILVLVLVVVAYNVFQGLERKVLERANEIGLLYSTGVPKWAIQLIFITQGAVIGIIGAFGGTLFGLLISKNLGGFFSLVEKIINFLLELIYMVKGESLPVEINIFSPATFYIVDIPSRLILGELFLLISFAIFAPTISGLIASLRILKINNIDILRM